MGRTKRKRNRKQIIPEFEDRHTMINLQKSMRLKCPHLQISYFKGTGRGIKCKKKIDVGDVLISLPLHQLITSKVNCDIFATLTLANKPPQLLLSVFLVYEAHLKVDSKYFDYIESLPRCYTNLYFCTEDEIKLLPDTLTEVLLLQQASLNKTFKELLDILNDKTCPHCGVALKHLFTQEKFHWAWFTVNTRSVYYQDESGADSLALAPILDMFNHSNDANIKMCIDFKNQVYILKTMVKYKKFEQVYIKYGSHSNVKLLVEYGFIVPKNLHDFVEFTFEEVVEGVKEFDINCGQITKLKYSFIKKNNLNQNLTKSKDEFSWSFKGLIYILVTTDQNICTLQYKVYSCEFSSVEQDKIEKISKIIATKKVKDFSKALFKMRKIEKCSESFILAKNLVKIYINLLE